MYWKQLQDQAALATGNFAKLFGNIEIPPLPQMAVQLLEMSRQEDIEIADITRAISNDAGLAAKILKTVNSAQFFLPTKVTDIHHGVALLGVKRIQSLALGYSTAGVLPKQAPGFNHTVFWQDSIQRAVFARTIVSQISPGLEGESFTGALLQNMAIPILLSTWGQYYQPVMAQSLQSKVSLVEIENQEFSWNHAQAGAWMARNWGFPDMLVCCIGLHHATLDEVESLQLAGSPVIPVVLSAQLPYCREVLSKNYHLSDENIRKAYAETDTACNELAQLFDVPPPLALADQLDVERSA